MVTRQSLKQAKIDKAEADLLAHRLGNRIMESPEITKFCDRVARRQNDWDNIDPMPEEDPRYQGYWDTYARIQCIIVSKALTELMGRI